jgi:hypothetical protein
MTMLEEAGDTVIGTCGTVDGGGKQASRLGCLVKMLMALCRMRLAFLHAELRVGSCILC